MLLSLPHAQLLLAAVGQTTALALWGRQQPRNNGTSSLDKRQGTVLITKFSTIYPTGDASRPRTANSGYDCRVDLLNDLWGFCPNTVIAATDCGLAGSCVDSFSCSKGCGRTDSPYTTFTCSESNAPVCSTALLTLPNNVGPFTYLACGRGPSTDVYFAFTTTAKPSSSPQPTSSPTTSTSPRETARTNTASSTPQQTPQSTDPSKTAPPASSPTASDTITAQSAPAPSSSSPNNTGAIIGGTFGCLALLCGCLIVIFWLRHRNKNAAAAAAAAAAKTGSSSSDEASGVVLHPSPPDYKGEGGLGLYEPAELSARTPAAVAGWRGYPAMSPVELPGSMFGGEMGVGR